MFWIGLNSDNLKDKRIYGYNSKKYYDIKDMVFSVRECIDLYTTFETLRLSTDHIVLTDKGPKKAMDVQKDDRLKHPLGFEPIVVDKSRKIYNMGCKLVIDGDDYMQYQSALIKI